MYCYRCGSKSHDIKNYQHKENNLMLVKTLEAKFKEAEKEIAELNNLCGIRKKLITTLEENRKLQQSDIKELAEALKESADKIMRVGRCADVYVTDKVKEYQALANKHLKKGE